MRYRLDNEAFTEFDHVSIQDIPISG